MKSVWHVARPRARSTAINKRRGNYTLFRIASSFFRTLSTSIFVWNYTEVLIRVSQWIFTGEGRYYTNKIDVNSIKIETHTYAFYSVLETRVRQRHFSDRFRTFSPAHIYKNGSFWSGPKPVSARFFPTWSSAKRTFHFWHFSGMKQLMPRWTNSGFMLRFGVYGPVHENLSQCFRTRNTSFLLRDFLLGHSSRESLIVTMIFDLDSNFTVWIITQVYLYEIVE